MATTEQRIVSSGRWPAAVNHAVSSDEPIEPGTMLDVGLGVSFTPVSDWLLNTDEPQRANLALVDSSRIPTI